MLSRMPNGLRCRAAGQLRIGTIHLAVAALIGAAIQAPLSLAPAAASQPCAQAQDSAAQAALMATACQMQVENLSARTPQSQELANPNGTRELRQFWEPQWAKRPNGSWA